MGAGGTLARPASMLQYPLTQIGTLRKPRYQGKEEFSLGGNLVAQISHIQ